MVGSDSNGQALVLTNAHVAGTRKGRTVKCQRWNVDGTNERGSGVIIAAGYANGLPVDFALLRASQGFAKGVTPIPLADCYPDSQCGVTTMGCPRCEWPSLQVLSVQKNEGQILKWFPMAIGGRSGSSLIDYSDGTPKVVGLLTWRSGNYGMGHAGSSGAMRGRMPTSFESL